MTMSADKYIGRPWVNGGQGPQAFDCWGFVRYVYAQEYGIPLAAIDVSAYAALAVRRAAKEAAPVSDFVSVDLLDLEDADIVLCSQAKHPHHVGIWIGGGLLHCVEGAGVVYQTRQSLQRHGWNLISGYRRAS